MTLQTGVPLLHVLAALLLVGHGLGTPLLIAAIRGAPTGAALRPWLLFARDGARLNPPAALVLLATGAWLGRGRWDEGWLQVSAALWLVNSALAVRVVGAVGQRIGMLVGTEDGTIPLEADVLRYSVRWEAAAWAMIAVDLATLVLMYEQPGLAGAIAVVAGAFAAVFGARAVRSRRGAAPAPGISTSA